MIRAQELMPWWPSCFCHVPRGCLRHHHANRKRCRESGCGASIHVSHLCALQGRRDAQGPRDVTGSCRPRSWTSRRALGPGDTTAEARGQRSRQAPSHREQGASVAGFQKLEWTGKQTGFWTSVSSTFPKQGSPGYSRCLRETRGLCPRRGGSNTEGVETPVSHARRWSPARCPQTPSAVITSTGPRSEIAEACVLGKHTKTPPSDNPCQGHCFLRNPRPGT